MDHKTFKRFQHVNTAANIAACGTCIAVFGLNPIAIGLSYIGTDILFSMIDAAIEKGFLEKHLEPCDVQENPGHGRRGKPVLPAQNREIRKGW